MSTNNKIFKNKILVFEGLPTCGKTSLANHLRDYYGFLKVNESLGKLGANNTINQKIVFEETIAKYTSAKKNCKPAIIDRGYPSMLAWDYCAEKMGYAKDLVEKTKWVEEAIKQRKLFEPYLYIYLLVKPEESLLRRSRNETKIDVWSGITGMQYCLEYYEQFFCKMKKANFVSIDSNQSVDKIVRVIIKKIKQKSEFIE